MLAWARNAWDVVASNYKAGQFSWPLIIYLAIVHLIAVAGIFAIPYCKAETLLWAFLLWPIT